MDLLHSETEMLTMSARDRKGQRQGKEGGRGEDRGLLDSEQDLALSLIQIGSPNGGTEQVSFTVTTCLLPKADLPRGLGSICQTAWGDSGG